MPEWLEQIYGEMTKPPYFLQNQRQNEASERSRDTDDEHRAGGRHGEIHRSSSHRDRTTQYESDEQNDNTNVVQSKTNARLKQDKRRDHGTGSARTMYMYIPQPVLERYPFRVERREQLPEVLCVYTKDDKRYAVKRTEIGLPHVRFIHRALTYAQRQGFNRYSHFALTKKKSPGLMYDGSVYYATEWVEGQPANFASVEHVAQTAYALAQFHEATKGFTTEKYTPQSVFDLFGMTQQRNRDLRQMLQRTEARNDKDSFDELFVSLKPQLLDDAAESLQILQQSECTAFLQDDKTHPGLSHLDVIPGNCLYAPDHNVYLIDFELSTFAPRALDVAHLLRRSLQLTNWNGDSAYACFLHFNAVKSMPKVEYQLVQSLLQFPYRAWRLAHTRYHFFAESSQTEELQAYADEESRRHQFLESLANQVRSLSADEG